MPFWKKKKEPINTLELDKETSNSIAEIGSLIDQIFRKLEGAKKQNEQMRDLMTARAKLYQTLAESHEKAIESINRVLKPFDSEQEKKESKAFK